MKPNLFHGIYAKQFKSLYPESRKIAVKLLQEDMDIAEILTLCIRFSNQEKQTELKWYKSLQYQLSKLIFFPGNYAYQLKSLLDYQEVSILRAYNLAVKYHKKYLQTQAIKQAFEISKLVDILKKYLTRMDKFTKYSYYRFTCEHRSRKTAFFLKDLSPTTRKVALHLLMQNHPLPQVMNRLQEFQSYETELYSSWNNTMLKELERLRLDFESYAYSLFTRLDKKELSVEKALYKARKRMEMLNKNHYPLSRQLKNVISILSKYQIRNNDFSNYAFTIMLNGDLSALKQETDKHLCNEKQLSEDCLFLLQCLKHVASLQDTKRPVPPEQLTAALDVSFSDNPKILDMQTNIVFTTYQYEACENLELAKDIVYQFIAKLIQVKKIIHPTLLRFLFLGKWISPKTFHLFMDNYDTIKLQGKTVLVFSETKKLYQELNLDKVIIKNHNEEGVYIGSIFTESDKFIITLYNKFVS